jgi:hypothetical protein
VPRDTVPTPRSGAQLRREAAPERSSLITVTRGGVPSFGWGGGFDELRMVEETVAAAALDAGLSNCDYAREATRSLPLEGLTTFEGEQPLPWVAAIYFVLWCLSEPYRDYVGRFDMTFNLVLTPRDISVAVTLRPHRLDA